jgi:methionyl-tRNA formyltransferase
MRMDSGLDTGPVYATARVIIEPGATTPSLTTVLADLGASTLIDVLGGLERGDIAAQPQPESGVTYAPRLGRDDGRVEWERRSALEVDRMVRALQPWPGVVAPLAGVDVRVEEGVAVLGADGAVPGSVVRHEGESVVIAAREGAYRVDLITPPGKRAMTPAAFLRGRRPRSEAPAS